MSYQDELRAKLDAVRPEEVKAENIVDVQSREQAIFEELEEAFEVASFDLDEDDVLRTLKILSILDAYPNVFSRRGALKLFYTLSRIDIVTPKSLLQFLRLPTTEFKEIIQAMAKAGLLFRNGDGELELTMAGQSLAARIGVESYL